MNLLDSLLDALVRLQGDALVMHAGEKPYVVTTSPGMQARGGRAWGQVELSSRVLTHELVSTMAGQILPPAQRRALDELGAVEHDIAPPSGVADRFTVVAARGGDDIWLEVRRQAVRAAAAEAARPSAAEPPYEPPVSAEDAGDLAPGGNGAGIAGTVELVDEESQSTPTDADVDAMLAATASVLLASVDKAVNPPTPRRTPVTDSRSDVATPSSAALEMEAPGTIDRDRTDRPREGAGAQRPAAARETAQPAPGSTEAPLRQVLGAAASRGASMVYLAAGSRPMVRIGGDFETLEGLPAFSAEQLEQGLRSLPPLDTSAHQAEPGEWVSDVPGAGRVRCLRFHDHRGPGVIVRLVPPSAISADRLRLPDEIRQLCSTDGIVLVSGAPGSGKSTLVNGIVDLINRTRADHVVTVEPRIHFVHSSERSFISQREPGKDPAAIALAIREAVREDPDVIVVEDVASADVALAALQAVHAGRLVVLSVQAPSPAQAIAALLEVFPPDERPRVQTALSAELRAVVSQMLVRNATGGRTPAREVLFNTSAVASLVRDGRVQEVGSTAASEGHVTLDAALASLVRDGAVHVAEAVRKASDRDGLVRRLQQEGVDTAFAEKLA